MPIRPPQALEGDVSQALDLAYSLGYEPAVLPNGKLQIRKTHPPLVTPSPFLHERMDFLMRANKGAIIQQLTGKGLGKAASFGSKAADVASKIFLPESTAGKAAMGISTGLETLGAVYPPAEIPAALKMALTAYGSAGAAKLAGEDPGSGFLQGLGAQAAQEIRPIRGIKSLLGRWTLPKERPHLNNFEQAKWLAGAVKDFMPGFFSDLERESALGPKGRNWVDLIGDLKTQTELQNYYSEGMENVKSDIFERIMQPLQDTRHKIIQMIKQTGNNPMTYDQKIALARFNQEWKALQQKAQQALDVFDKIQSGKIQQGASTFTKKGVVRPGVNWLKSVYKYGRKAGQMKEFFRLVDAPDILPKYEEINQNYSMINRLRDAGEKAQTNTGGVSGKVFQEQLRAPTPERRALQRGLGQHEPGFRQAIRRGDPGSGVDYTKPGFFGRVFGHIPGLRGLGISGHTPFGTQGEPNVFVGQRPGLAPPNPVAQAGASAAKARLSDLLLQSILNHQAQRSDYMPLPKKNKGE